MSLPQVTDKISCLDTAAMRYEQNREEFLEMAQLKSDLDISQLTVNSQGPFPAHKFHFLCRQYSLALLELRRLYNDKALLERQIDYVVGKQDDPENAYYVDIELESLQIQVESLELSIGNKQAMCNSFEQCRNQLLTEHGGKPFTNDEYQAEEPKYWRWYFLNMMQDYQYQAVSGIPSDIFKNLKMLAASPYLDKKFQIPFNEMAPKAAGAIQNAKPLEIEVD